MARRCVLAGQGDGRYTVSGDLGFEAVPDLLEESRAPFSAEQRIEVDLSGVESSDSAGLALLIEWIRMARARGVPIEYTGVPDQLMALARISDLDGLFERNAPVMPDQRSSSVSSSSSHSSSSSSGSTGGSPS